MLYNLQYVKEIYSEVSVLIILSLVLENYETVLLPSGILPNQFFF
jgi:hypothetical protein